MSEKPLNVRVAEALGFTEVKWDVDGGYGKPPVPGYETWPIPRYDTDWSATGPLIESLFVCLKRTGFPDTEAWQASVAEWVHDYKFSLRRDGETALVAVCNLILALKEAGKL